ncbi:MAG: hypothetical protein WBW73_10435 [Rhodoplanes sp.]
MFRTRQVSLHVQAVLLLTCSMGVCSLRSSARAAELGHADVVAARAIEARQPVSVPKPAGDRLFYATVYADIWAHTDLLTLPLDAAAGTLRTDRVYFVGVGLGYTLIPSFSVPMPFCACGINGLRLEVEGQLGSYFGLQDHLESALVLLLRSPQFPLLAGFSANVAIGEGVSYAYSLPNFEGSVAAEGLDAAGPRKFLNYLAYEMEFSHEQVKNWHLLLNVRHRSGIWGVIAPHKTGANYIGGGIRADF